MSLAEKRDFFYKLWVSPTQGGETVNSDFIHTKGRDDMAKNLKMKAARAALDLSQDELAKKAGVTRQTISAVENGDYNPTINLCIAICKALGKTLDDLFWEESK